MCLFGRAPAWEDDITFANRRHGRKHRSTRITETTIERNPKYVRHSPPPRPRTPVPVPIIKPATPSPPPPPPPAPKAPSPKPSIKKPPVPTPPPQPVIELVSVEEESRRSSPPKSRRRSRGGEEVYIERERIRERGIPSPPQEEYETYRYVEAPMPPRRDEAAEERVERRRSRSITYQSNPRSSGRVTERERVVIEDGGRRREYYRKP